MSRWCDPQLQLSENYSDLTKWRSNLFNSCWLMSHFIFNMFKSNVLIKNENSKKCGTGGQRVKWQFIWFKTCSKINRHSSHRLFGVELLFFKVIFCVVWDSYHICWLSAPPPPSRYSAVGLIAVPLLSCPCCYAFCAKSDLKPVYLSCHCGTLYLSEYKRLMSLLKSHCISLNI